MNAALIALALLVGVVLGRILGGWLSENQAAREQNGYQPSTTITDPPPPPKGPASASSGRRLACTGKDHGCPCGGGYSSDGRHYTAHRFPGLTDKTLAELSADVDDAG